MRSSAEPQLISAIERAYTKGYSLYGDLGLAASEYTKRLVSIMQKLSEPGASLDQDEALLESLHTSDLYIAIACSLPTEAAWLKFRARYRKYIFDLARSACSTADAAREVADGVLADLFLYDRLGRSRIASYDGRSTLATWLRAVVTNRAINEREKRSNNLDCIESISEPADRSYAVRFEASMRATRYGAMIKDSFKTASRNLTERERLILLLRYDDMLQSVDIAGMLGVHPSTITRSLQQTHRKLRRTVASILRTKYGLCEEAILECFEHILETPGHSILAYVKTGLQDSVPRHDRITQLLP